MATDNYELLPLQELHQQSVLEDECDVLRVEATKLSYNDFYWNWMHTNRPVVITNISNDWKCRVNWTRTQPSRNVTDTRTINFDCLREKVGNVCVPVANCGKEYYDSHEKIEMRFFDFLEYWERAETNTPATQQCNTTDMLYLKDWHLQSAMPNYAFYEVPKYFASDWLNEQLVSSGHDDYRFVYMGPKGSWTPFHADVFGSYSWSTNIVGTKKWLLLPPGEEQKLTDKLGNKPFSIDEELLRHSRVKYFVIHQEANEAIFVPSGWYHQVLNVSDTISVNHNWFNACNIARIWRNLACNMQKVITEIDDCRQMDNFDEHCQMMLRASFGMNYLDFLDMLEFIAKRRLQFYDTENNTIFREKSFEFLLFNKYKLNDIHIRHDLLTIKALLDEIIQDVVVCNSRATLYRRCLSLSELLKNI